VPVELVVATDLSLQFLQVSAEPAFIFRVFERIVLRIKDTGAIIALPLGRRFCDGRAGPTGLSGLSSLHRVLQVITRPQNVDLVLVEE
jgi:hypothetical protein